MAKRRGGYTMDLKRQIRLRISEDMFNSVTEIADKANTTLSKAMRDLLRFALRGIMQTK